VGTVSGASPPSPLPFFFFFLFFFFFFLLFFFWGQKNQLHEIGFRPDFGSPVIFQGSFPVLTGVILCFFLFVYDMLSIRSLLTGGIAEHSNQLLSTLICLMNCAGEFAM